MAIKPVEIHEDRLSVVCASLEELDPLSKQLMKALDAWMFSPDDATPETIKAAIKAILAVSPKLPAELRSGPAELYRVVSLDADLAKRVMDNLAKGKEQLIKLKARPLSSYTTSKAVTERFLQFFNGKRNHQTPLSFKKTFNTSQIALNLPLALEWLLGNMTPKQKREYSETRSHVKNMIKLEKEIIIRNTPADLIIHKGEIVSLLGVKGEEVRKDVDKAQKTGVKTSLWDDPKEVIQTVRKKWTVPKLRAEWEKFTTSWETRINAKPGINSDLWLDVYIRFANGLIFHAFIKGKTGNKGVADMSVLWSQNVSVSERKRKAVMSGNVRTTEANIDLFVKAINDQLTGYFSYVNKKDLEIKPMTPEERKKFIEKRHQERMKQHVR